LGDSRDYLGCSKGMYLLNFECVACNGGSQWIDYQGFNCLTTCDEGDSIYAPNGQQLCRTQMPACSNALPQVTATQVTTTDVWLQLTCVDCSAQKDLNGFCVASCKDYFQANPGCAG